jgi:Tfp pilus assembly protein PilV
MGKVRTNQSGFTAVEVLLVLIFVAIVAFIGVYVAHNRNAKTTASTTQSTTTPAKKTTTDTQTPQTHTAQDATAFTQKTYNDFLAAIHNAGTDNTQPLGIVGLNAVKDNLTSGFYTKAAASHNGGDFSCAAQFVPNKYTASLASSDKTNAIVALTISNSDDGLTTTSGMQATVDLASLKITSVTCPN